MLARFQPIGKRDVGRLYRRVFKISGLGLADLGGHAQGFGDVVAQITAPASHNPIALDHAVGLLHGPVHFNHVHLFSPR